MCLYIFIYKKSSTFSIVLISLKVHHHFWTKSTTPISLISWWLQTTTNFQYRMASEFQILEWWVYYKYSIFLIMIMMVMISHQINYDPNDPAKVDLTLCLGSLSWYSWEIHFLKNALMKTASLFQYLIFTWNCIFNALFVFRMLFWGRSFAPGGGDASLALYRVAYGGSFFFFYKKNIIIFLTLFFFGSLIQYHYCSKKQQINNN